MGVANRGGKAIADLRLSYWTRQAIKQLTDYSKEGFPHICDCKSLVSQIRTDNNVPQNFSLQYFFAKKVGVGYAILIWGLP